MTFNGKFEKMLDYKFTKVRKIYSMCHDIPQSLTINRLLN